MTELNSPDLFPAPESKPNLSPQTREKELLGTIQEIEVPFMEALQQVYGERRGWRMCGPASIALSRILSTRTGVPIGRDIEGEHIELTVGIFDPQQAPDRLQRMEEQTYIRYHTGDGSIYYIDPIYGLLMQGKQDFHEAIQVEKYEAGTIDQQLIEKHNLYPFEPNHNGIEACKVFASLKTAKERALYIEDSVAALNDERATMSEFVADSKHTMSTDWQKTEGIIKEFAPNWEVDILAKLNRLQEISQAILQQHSGRLASAGVMMQPSRFEGVSLSGRTEIVYHDQAPRVESWGIKADEKERVLTFHTGGERYVLKGGEGLQVYKDGRLQKLTQTHLDALRQAVGNVESTEAKSFFEANIPTSKSE